MHHDRRYLNLNDDRTHPPEYYNPEHDMIDIIVDHRTLLLFQANIFKLVI
jgi:hypothetical protein